MKRQKTVSRALVRILFGVLLSAMVGCAAPTAAPTATVPAIATATVTVPTPAAKTVPSTTVPTTGPIPATTAPTTAPTTVAKVAPKGTLVIAQSEDPQRFDPVPVGNAKAVGIMYSIYDTLTRRDPAGNIGLWAAESQEVVNETTYRYKLRKGIKFSDGENLTGESVRFSLQMLRDAKSVYAADYALIDRIDLPDPYTVDIITSKPFPALPRQLATLFLLPPEYVKKNGHEYLDKAPLGSGPYKFVKYLKDERVELVANEDYWKGAPKIKTLIYRTIPEASTQIAALLAGEVGIIDTVLPDQIPVLKNNPNIEVVSSPVLRTVAIYMDNRHGGPFADKRVREAMNYAIDINAIIKGVLGGAGTRIATFAIPPWEGFDKSVTPYPYDPEKAKKLLADAGYATGLSLTITVATGDHFPTQVAEVAADQLKKVGVTAKVVTMEKGAFLEKVGAHKGDPNFYFFSLGGVKTGIDTIADSALSCKGRWTEYCNPDLDKLISEAQVTVDPVRQNTILGQIQKIAKDDVPYVWGWQHHAIWAYNKQKVQNWQPYADQAMFTYGASAGE